MWPANRFAQSIFHAGPWKHVPPTTRIVHLLAAKFWRQPANLFPPRATADRARRVQVARAFALRQSRAVDIGQGKTSSQVFKQNASLRSANSSKFAYLPAFAKPILFDDSVVYASECHAHKSNSNNTLREFLSGRRSAKGAPWAQ